MSNTPYRPRTIYKVLLQTYFSFHSLKILNKSKEMVKERKNAIIQQHEELSKSVSNQKILLRDKEDLLDRLDEISKNITENRKPTHEDLEQWEHQLGTINEALKIALSKS